MVRKTEGGGWGDKRTEGEGNKVYWIRGFTTAIKKNAHTF